MSDAMLRMNLLHTRVYVMAVCVRCPADVRWHAGFFGGSLLVGICTLFVSCVTQSLVAAVGWS